MKERRRSYYRRSKDYTPQTYKETNLAYLAGIVDGEGCFWIGKVPKKVGDGYVSEHYRGLLKIDNTDKKLIEWIDIVFSGTSSARCRSTSSRKFERDIYTWNATGDRLLDICELILPYLVIKKEHCEVMIKFRKSYQGITSGKAIPEEILQIRQECLESSRKLNSRWHLHPLKGNI